MNEQQTSQTSQSPSGMDRFFATLRGIPVRRRTDNKWIGGVCSGLADRLDVDPVIVRAGFVLLFILGGVGITVYLVAWVLLPNDRDEIVAERAVVNGEGRSILLLILAVFALFGGSWWSSDAGYSGWGFPWLLALTGLFIWWLVQRTHSNPEADRMVRAQQASAPHAAGPPTTPYTAGPPTTPYTAGPPTTPYTAGPPTTPYTAGPPTTRYAAGPPPTASLPVAPRKPRRRSGGPLMALLAIGLALVTYGSLVWAGKAFSWAGDHQTIAFAGSLAAIGLLTVGLGIAGWRAGFVTFLAVVLAITAWTSSVIPTGIQLGGRVGDATWAPTSVSSSGNYHLGVGNGVLDLSGLPADGLSGARLPAYVGLGELEVRVPEGLTVQVVGHVGLGEILLPGESQNGAGSNGQGGQGGSDVSRSTVIGDGPVEVVVDAGVGVGQLTVVKE